MGVPVKMLPVIDDQPPIGLRKFANRTVKLKLEDNLEVQGLLVDADKSRHGRLGNILLVTKNGRQTLIRGNMVQSIAIFRGGTR